MTQIHTVCLRVFDNRDMRYEEEGLFALSAKKDSYALHHGGAQSHKQVKHS